MKRCGRINAELTGDLLDRYLEAEPECFRLLERAAAKLAFSARAYQRVQRVGRTIADLAGETRVLPDHVAEALALRHLDRDSK